MIDAGNSTLEAISPTGGAIADGTTEATIRVTVRDDAGAVVPNAQVQARPQSAQSVDVDHAHVNAAATFHNISYTNAAGVADFPTRTLFPGAVSYLVEAGQDDDLIGDGGTGLGFGKPERDFSVGAGATPTLYDTEQTIDAAWLTANTTSGVVRNVAFTGGCTLAVAGVEFENCRFARGAGGSYALTTGGFLHTATDCSFRGCDVAGFIGPGGTYIRCRFTDHLGGAAIIGPNGGLSPTQFRSCLFRGVGGSGNAAYAVNGTPGELLRFDHCWFDLAGSNVLQFIHQETVAAGSESTLIIGCWFNGGTVGTTTAVIGHKEGASGQTPTNLTVLSCRFDQDPALIPWVSFDGDAPLRQGLVSDVTGVLDTTQNSLSGVRFRWPVTQLGSVSLTWEETGGGTGGGSGGSGGGGTGNGQTSGEGGGIQVGVPGAELLIGVTENLGESLGGGGGGDPGGGGNRSTIKKDATPVDAENPGASPPLVVNWTVAEITAAEGDTVGLFARLTTQDGGPPLAGQLQGFTVQLEAGDGTLAGTTTATAGDYQAPTSITFPAGSDLASAPVTVLDEGEPSEGDESFRLTLQTLTGDIGDGETTLIVPGSTSFIHVRIPANQADPTVFFRLPSVLRPEASVPYAIQVGISGNPTAQVVARVAFNSGASSAVRPDDFIIEGLPAGGNANARTLTFNPTGDGSTPPDQTVVVDIVDDTLDENAESAVFDLTVDQGPALVGSQTQFTLTISDDDNTPSVPEIGFRFVSYAVTEAQTRAIEVYSLASDPFDTLTDVPITVRDLTAEFGGDYTIDWNNQGGAVPGFARFLAGDSSHILYILASGDAGVAEGSEFFELEVEPGAAYTLRPGFEKTTVEIRDPVGSQTEITVQRIQGVPRSIVRASVYVPETVDPENGYSIRDANGVDWTAQWHPLSYRPDGQPDVVHVFGMVPGAADSYAGDANALQVVTGTGSSPAGLISLSDQLATISGLTLRVKQPNEASEYSLAFISGGGADPLVEPGLSTRQGGGERLYGRYQAIGRPTKGSGTTEEVGFGLGSITADLRSDMNAVVLAVTWHGGSWKAPTSGSSYTHATQNPYVPGEAFFEYLRLDDLPAGWEARGIDPRSTDFGVIASQAVAGWDAGNSRFDIIKPYATTVYGQTGVHYLPVLRGHMAYVVLYETATVTEDVALEVLRNRGVGVTSGGMGLDLHDSLGELGTPMFEYGRANFTDPQHSNFTGWRAAAQTAKDRRDRIRDAIALGSEGGGVTRRRGWWHGLDDTRGDASGGTRISMGAGMYPIGWTWEQRRLELIHIFHRTGHMVQDATTGAHATDEDFCDVDGAGLFKCATAMGGGKSGQRMAHQHFLPPDCHDVVEGVRLAPGHNRAQGEILLDSNNPPLDGDTVTITDGVAGTPTVFTFRAVPGSSTTYAREVQIGDLNASGVSLVNAILVAPDCRMHARKDGNTLRLMHRYHGAVGNQALASSNGTRLGTVGMTGGADNAGARTWNKLDPATHGCDYDIDLSWHLKPMATGGGWNDHVFHIFDTGHLARMNDVTRDGWWLMFDPLAHDMTVSLMHLMAQCHTRYLESRSSVFLTAAGADDQLNANHVRSSWAAIYEAHNRRGLLGYVRRGLWPHSSDTTWADESQGLNVGYWVGRNVNRAPEDWDPAPGSGTADFNLVPTSKHALRRGHGWAMMAFARGYAIEGAHRPTATKDVIRDLYHGGRTYLDDRPSWIELAFVVTQLTAHKCGAVSSSDEKGWGPATYADSGLIGPTDFDAQTGFVPGGPLNTVPAGGEFEDEHYAVTRPWWGLYYTMGLYALYRRAYRHTYLGQSSLPSPGDTQMLRLRNVWRHHLHLFRTAQAYYSPAFFQLPDVSLVGVGDPALTGTAQSTGRRGRFNTEGANADPDTVFETRRLHWELKDEPNFFAAEYMLHPFLFSRLYGGSEILDLMKGLGGVGGAPTQALYDALYGEWQTALQGSSSRYSDIGDERAHILQWLLNDTALLG